MGANAVAEPQTGVVCSFSTHQLISPSPVGFALKLTLSMERDGLISGNVGPMWKTRCCAGKPEQVILVG